jgi:hypothetical protein
MQNLRNVNANCRLAVESIGSGKLTKQIDQWDRRVRKSALWIDRSGGEGENHIPKYPTECIVPARASVHRIAGRVMSARSSRGISIPTCDKTFLQSSPEVVSERVIGFESPTQVVRWAEFKRRWDDRRSRSCGKSLTITIRSMFDNN